MERKDAEATILISVLKRVHGDVVNQARYEVKLGLFDDIWDDMYTFADTMTDEDTFKFLKGKPILARDNLLELVATMGVTTLYDGDGWVDDVAEYIIKHADDCMDLWNHMAEGARASRFTPCE